MKIYRIPQKIGAIIFDIDGTLYTSPEYVHEQVDVQIRYYAKTHGMTEQEARDSITAYRKEWSSAHQGKSISLGNTLTAFGIPIETSIKWRSSSISGEGLDFMQVSSPIMSGSILSAPMAASVFLAAFTGLFVRQISLNDFESFSSVSISSGFFLR